MPIFNNNSCHHVTRGGSTDILVSGERTEAAELFGAFSVVDHDILRKGHVDCWKGVAEVATVVGALY
jgi:hypothetical protein